MGQTFVHAQRWAIEVRHALGDDKRVCEYLAFASERFNDPTS